MIKALIVMLSFMIVTSSSFLILFVNKTIEAEPAIKKMEQTYKNIYKVGHYDGCVSGVLLACRYGDCAVVPIEELIEKCIDRTHQLDVDLDKEVSSDKEERE